MFSTIKELVALATEQKKPISEIMIEQEMEMTQQSREYIWEKMEKNLQTMKNAVERSVEGEGVFSPTGLTGGDALKMKKYRERGKTLSGDSILAGVTIRAWNETKSMLQWGLYVRLQQQERVEPYRALCSRLPIR